MILSQINLLTADIINGGNESDSILAFYPNCNPLIMDDNIQQPDSKLLLELVSMKMPFGKYKGTILCNLPVSYLEWFVAKGGFPAGKLGMLLSTMYEIKLNGLEGLLTPLKR